MTLARDILEGGYQNSVLNRKEIRSERINPANLNLNIVVKIGNQNLDVENISESGCCFLSDEIFEKGATVEHLEIVFNNADVLYVGSGRIVWQSGTEPDFRYGLELSTKTLDEGILRGLKEAIELQTDVKDDLRDYLNLPQDFLTLVYEVRTYLAKVKTSLESIEKRVHIQATPIQHSYFKAVELVMGAEFVTQMSKYSKRLFHIDRMLVEKNMKDLAKRVFRSELHEYFKSGSFVNRAWEKPLGYAGDYVMMRQIYEDGYIGQDLFSKLIHKWGINEASSQSVRYRKDYLIRNIKELSTDDENFVCGSLACGPAKEVSDFLAQVPIEESHRYTFVLMDQDKEALLLAKRNTTDIKLKRGLGCRLIFLPLSVKSVLEGDPVLKDLKSLGFNFLYTAGLYDYLTQPVAKMLTKNIFEWLLPEGKLIIGNFHPDNPTHTISDYVADWSLILRDEATMMDLVSELEPKEKRLHHDELGIDLFLEVEKG